MRSGFCLLLASLLATAFFGLSDGSIKCYQCSECPDELPELTKCEKLTIVDATIDLTAKAQNVDKNDKGLQMLKQGIAVALEGQKPEDCFKMVLTKDGKDTVHRGCGPENKAGDICANVPETGITTCFCDDDGCNSSPTVLASFVLIACLSFIMLLF